MCKLKTQEVIGFWGKKRIEYLKDEEPKFYEELQQSGKLQEHLQEVEEKARARYAKEEKSMHLFLESDPGWNSFSKEEQEYRRQIVQEVAIDIVCNDVIWI